MGTRVRKVKIESIDPSTLEYGNLTTAQKQAMYLATVKKTNQRMRELENQGMTNSPIYVSLKSKGYTTRSGNVGFSTEGYKKWSASTLKKEYSKVYHALTAPSSSSAKKQYVEKMSEMLSHIGVDYDEMMENPKLYKQQLNEFWSLYNEAKEVGLFSKFNLGSYEAQEIIKEFMSERPNMPKAGRGAHQVALSAVKKVEKLEHDSVGLNQDKYKAKVLRDDYNANVMKSARDALLNKLAEHSYRHIFILV